MRPNSGPTEPTPVVIVDALVPAPVVVVTDVEKTRRATLEKELQGVRAKLRWTHLSDAQRAELESREVTLLGELRI